jgi:hypothetical protein
MVFPGEDAVTLETPARPVSYENGAGACRRLDIAGVNDLPMHELHEDFCLSPPSGTGLPPLGGDSPVLFIMAADSQDSETVERTRATVYPGRPA